ncbi:MAG: LTA synthase family protein [Shewanella sp.]
MEFYQYRVKSLVRAELYQLCWLVLILMAARWMMVQAFVDPIQVVDRHQDLWRMWLFGWRYDLRVAGIVIAPLLLAGLGLATIDWGWNYFSRIFPWVVALCTFIITVVAIGNFYYYQTYHNHIDVFIFGLAEDDTSAVLANMWQDYPVLKGIFVAVLLALPSYWFGRAVSLPKLGGGQSFLVHWPTSKFMLMVIFFVALVTVAARGSVGTFPLRRANAQVSELTVLNKLTPNGLMAIDWAIKDREEDINFVSVTRSERESLLKKLDLSSIEASIPVNNWLASHPPHVVMTLMESFGSNMLAFDSAGKNDLLGQLRGHFGSDIVFHRFLSGGNGTAPSLAALFFQSPAQNISHSSAQSKALGDTPFAIYKRAGYQVVFITSGNLMWRNLANYLPLQGVGQLYDQNALMAQYPESRDALTDWGVPDEYAYRLAQDILSKATQPTFISILTVTNHPPYVVPSNFQPAPVVVTPEMERHAEVGQIESENILRTFQYAADAFGQFVSNVKASDLGQRTLLAATGDHQMRRVKAYYPVEQVLDRAVPFYLYVPATIASQVPIHVDPLRVGSHKDIFPTLFALSLSDVSYSALGGRNLLAEKDDDARAFGYNEAIWIDQDGAYPLTGKPVRYPWRGDGLGLGEEAQPISTSLQHRLSAYPALLRWHLNARVKGVVVEQ